MITPRDMPQRHQVSSPEAMEGLPIQAAADPIRSYLAEPYIFASRLANGTALDELTHGLIGVKLASSTPDGFRVARHNRSANQRPRVEIVQSSEVVGEPVDNNELIRGVRRDAKALPFEYPAAYDRIAHIIINPNDDERRTHLFKLLPTVDSTELPKRDRTHLEKSLGKFSLSIPKVTDDEGHYGLIIARGKSTLSDKLAAEAVAYVEARLEQGPLRVRMSKIVTPDTPAELALKSRRAAGHLVT